MPKRRVSRRQPRAQVVEQQYAPIVRKRGQFLDVGKRRKADDAKVARVHAENCRCAFADRIREVPQVRAIGRPDLDQRRAALAQERRGCESRRRSRRPGRG